jgi:hypothetical protein
MVKLTPSMDASKRRMIRDVSTKLPNASEKAETHIGVRMLILKLASSRMGVSGGFMLRKPEYHLQEKEDSNSEGIA